MAVTNPSDLFIPEVSADYSSQAFVQSLELMNNLIGPVGSGSPIEIMNDPIFGVEGQYFQRPIFKRVGSTLVARRDVTSNSNTTPVNITGDNEIGVKVHRRIGPLNYTLDALNISRATPENFSAEVGKQIGEELALNMQHTIIATALGILAGVGSTVNTYSPWNATSRTNLSPAVLNATLNLMGDQRNKFKSGAHIVTRSECVLDLTNDGIGRSYQGVGDRALQGAMNVNTLGMGDPLMVDDALLTTADAGFDKYTTILFGAGAMQIWFTKPLTMYPVFQNTLPEQVEMRIRGDADFALGTHGAKYDSTNGGANPTDATIATSTNWDSTYTSAKEVRLLSAVHNYSGN